MSFAARSKPHICYPRAKPLLTIDYREGQKVRHRNFPKGYAEMLEKQHSQLACGLQEMYQRLRKASLWEGEPLDESSECPLTHDILAALNFLEPNEDGTNEEFVEQPLSSPILDESEDSIEKTSTNSSQATPKGTLHDIAMFVNPEHDSQNDFQISKSDLVINYSWPLSGPWAVEFAAA